MAKSSKKAKAEPKMAPPSPSTAAIQNPQSIVAPASPTFDTFTSFSRLPIELRLIVWSMTIEPRTVTVVFTPNSPVRPEWDRSLYWVGDHVPSKIDPAITMKSKSPVSLHVCQESRREVLKSYQLWLSTKRMVRTSRGHYFNPLLDRLYMTGDLDARALPSISDCGWNVFAASEHSAITEFRLPTLALDFQFLFSSGPFREIVAPPSISFENVDSLIFVLHTRNKTRSTGHRCSYMHGPDSHDAGFCDDDKNWFAETGYFQAEEWKEWVQELIGKDTHTGTILSTSQVKNCNGSAYVRRYIDLFRDKCQPFC